MYNFVIQYEDLIEKYLLLDLVKSILESLMQCAQLKVPSVSINYVCRSLCQHSASSSREQPPARDLITTLQPRKVTTQSISADLSQDCCSSFY